MEGGSLRSIGIVNSCLP